MFPKRPSWSAGNADFPDFANSIDFNRFVLSGYRGRGLGFYRGSRGRGGGGAGQGQNFRGGRGGGGRGGFKPGMPTTTKKEHLKFDSDYDFDKANDEFKEVLEKLQVRKIRSRFTFL